MSSDPEIKATPSQRPSVIIAKTERLKGYGAIIAIVLTNFVTLFTAISAHLKGEEEKTAKASYSELSRAIEDMSKEQIKLHKDLANLRGYISGQQNQPLVVSLDEDKGFAENFEKAFKKQPEPTATLKRNTSPDPLPKLGSDPIPYKAPEISKLGK